MPPQTDEEAASRVPAKPETLPSNVIPAAGASPRRDALATIRRTDASRRRDGPDLGRYRLSRRRCNERPRAKGARFGSDGSWRRGLLVRLADRAWSARKRRARNREFGHADWISTPRSCNRCSAFGGRSGEAGAFQTTLAMGVGGALGVLPPIAIDAVVLALESAPPHPWAPKTQLGIVPLRGAMGDGVALAAAF